MDFITKKLDQKIKFYEERKENQNVRIYLQVKVEYLLILILSYLWNQNYSKIDEKQRKYLYPKIVKPTIGDIVDMISKLDLNKKILNDKRISTAISQYPKFRNEKIGHGYSFEDDTLNFIGNLKEIIEIIQESVELIKRKINFINIDKEMEDIVYGVLYDSDGNYCNWMEPKSKCNLQKSLYISYEGFQEYYEISPFINISSDDEIYLFKSIEEVMVGKMKYNRIFSTDTVVKEHDFFKKLHVEIDEFKKASPNGTLINIFENNYSAHGYIENKVIQKKLSEFVESKSFVCGTLWGHGGVGKTAAIQNFCEKLGIAEVRRFDYILFISAKDRYFNCHTGVIEVVKCDTTYDTIIKKINKLIYGDESLDEQKIIEIQSKILIIIDDFETFCTEDKEKIEVFIRKLNINKHKVIITTRTNSIIGDEIKTDELDLDNTITFFIESYKEIFKLETYESPSIGLKEKIHKITSGRPIFILQFVYVCGKRDMDYSIGIDYKNEKQAIEFLYGRIYDYLGDKSKKIFSIMGVLADDDDMTNLLDKIKYILNLEDDESFNDSIDEIQKLRLVEIIENKFYRVYSKEILDIMKKYYENIDQKQKNKYKERMIRINKDKNSSNDKALLDHANSARYSQSEQAVISLYEQILKRKSAKKEIKITALCNMAEYLTNDRGNKMAALDKFEMNYVEFKNNVTYLSRYSSQAWSNNNKEKAVELLLDFFAISRPGLMKNEEMLELFGIFVTYRSLYWLELRDETKNGLKLKEIGAEEFKNQINEQKINFKDIKKRQGNIYCEILKNVNFDSCKSGTRQNLITGAYHLVEVCIRIKAWDMGNYICKTIIEELSKYTYGLDFKTKKKRIDNYKNK